ncbi:HesA/MoeB/ThiF family protein [Sphingomonas sp. LHG3406-1]|uniref:HesA/MoeB/ThiF family protein n=1 Tax=Sphingomonas sp. LHG3406-1 TaxID=2804617 RepID=UPI002624E766|nr:HesA/MoeB/ThiF family protein [Sphingomonas sp. LHG3406-1]
MLSDEELTRYARQIVLPQLGGAGQQRLKAAKVSVVGAGGIGAAVIPALAGAGIGRITIIDPDRADLSNLHRQPIYRSRDEGEPKAALAAQFVRRLNPFVEVAGVERAIGPDNAAALLEGHDLVIDGTDNFATRLAVSDACVGLGLPLISAAAAQWQGQVALFTGKPCYRCFVGDAFDADDCDNCAELGVTGALTGLAGNLAALLAIRFLAHAGEAEPGRLTLVDGLNGTQRLIRIVADPGCKACGGSVGRSAISPS